MMKVIEECHEAVHAMGCVSWRLILPLSSVSAPRITFGRIGGLEGAVDALLHSPRADRVSFHPSSRSLSFLQPRIATGKLLPSRLFLRRLLTLLRHFTDIRIGTRTDKQGSLEAKVASVTDLLAFVLSLFLGVVRRGATGADDSTRSTARTRSQERLLPRQRRPRSQNSPLATVHWRSFSLPRRAIGPHSLPRPFGITSLRSWLLWQLSSTLLPYACAREVLGCCCW